MRNKARGWRSRRSQAACCPNYSSVGALLEEFGDGDGETGQEFGGVDGIVGREEAIGASGVKDLNFAAVGVDDPDGVGAGGEVLFYFTHELADVVGGGEDF